MAIILRHASAAVVRRSLIHHKNSAPKCFLSDTTREKLWDAVDECKQLSFTAQRVSVLGHDFSSSGDSHDLVEFCCDEKGKFHDIRGTLDKKVGKLFAYDVSFNTLFKNGFRTIEHFLQESKLNHNGGTHLTLGALLKYLEDIDFHQGCLDMPIFRTELDVASVLAVHLFSQLAVDLRSTPSYMITNDFKFKYPVCPCDHPNCKHELMYGNIGFGSEYLFYDYPDIILFPQGVGSSSVVVPRNKGRKKEYKEQLMFNNEDDDHMQRVEVKSNEDILRSRESKNQFSSVAITFSYYQRLKHYRKKLENKNDQLVSIIPTIAICQDCFDIYMYDTEHDIFLRNVGDPIPLWEDEDNLSLSSVLILWMVLNHLQFIPKIPIKFMEDINGSSGVGQKLDTEKLELIRKTLRKTRSKFRHLRVNERNKRNVERITEEKVP